MNPVAYTDGSRDERLVRGGGYRPPPAPAKHPLFQWPIRPRETLGYFFGNPGYLWPYPLLFAGFATLSWLLLTPELIHMTDLSAGWIGYLWIRNFLLLAVIVGFLHQRLYGRKVQGTQYKYDGRWLATNNPNFLFRSQLWDNVFWTLCSAVPIWTAYEAATLWLHANGTTPAVSWESHPVYCTGLLLLTPVWMDIHFSTTHRLLHWKPLFKSIHSIHHKNFNPGPWSGLAMHPVEHLIFFSAVIPFWFIPSHPIHGMFILAYLVFGDIAGHHGFDRLIITKRISIGMNHYMHYLHHKHLVVNYGNGVLPFDRWFGTFHDGSDDAARALKDRLRARAVGAGVSPRSRGSTSGPSTGEHLG